jgi:hypothetical protein
METYFPIFDNIYERNSKEVGDRFKGEMRGIHKEI